MSAATVTIRDPSEDYGIDVIEFDPIHSSEDEHGLTLRYRDRDVFVPWASVVRVDYVGRRPELWDRYAA